MKTISLRCLVDDAGMKDSCRSDMSAAGGSPTFGKFIYNTSLPIFLNAFASQNITEGGCPAI